MSDNGIRAGDLKLFRDDRGTLRMLVADNRTYVTVKIHRAAPLSNPNGYIAFLDGKGYEICTIQSLNELDEESQRIAEAELARRYLTARVHSIISLLPEFATSYWEVDTDRGVRDFVVQGLSENCVWLGEDHVMLIDVDGNRFEIPSIAALDERSRMLLADVL